MVEKNLTSKSIKKPMKISKVTEKKGKKSIVVTKAKPDKIYSSVTHTVTKKTKQTEPAGKAASAVVTGSSQRKEEEKKYYTNFDFYFKRTSFRTMTAYYKQGF